MAMGPPVLVALDPPPPRTRPPRVAADAVERPRLQARLDEGGAGLLTVVGAPAGFGKTTLLAQWATARRDVAWLSLDEDDAVPAALWAGMAAALERIRPGSGGKAVESTPAAIARLLERARPAALVLDAYERIVGSAAEEALWQLVRERPPLQLVLSGRAEPTLPLATARARGELLEIRAGDLRLSPEEAVEFVRRPGRGSLGADAETEMVERCDGWAAALRLAVREGVGGGWGAQVRELVTDEILAGRDAEREFLVRTAILDELSGPLCDAVLETDGSDELLDRLAAGNLLVERTAGGGAYRLERAARHVLVAELERGDPALARELHRRAAAWHGAHGPPGAAVEHLLACGETKAATRAFGRSWPAVVDAGGRERALGWLERLPADPADARLALARGWLLRLDGRRAESEAWLDAARTAVPPRARRTVVQATVLARAVLPWDDVGRGLALARRARRSESAGPRRALAAWALGWTSWWSGDSDAAATALAEARGGPLLVRIAADAVLARIALERGDERRAAELVERAAAEVDDHGLADLPELGMLATAAALLAARRGDRSAALAELERGVRLRRAWGHPLETVDALLAAAPVVAAELGRRPAADLLAEARRLLAVCPDPGVLPDRLAEASHAALPRPGSSRSHDDELTPRERTVLALLVQGRSKREIAEELYVSFNTVHSHTKAVYRKLGVSSRGEAIERARELGIA